MERGTNLTYLEEFANFHATHCKWGFDVSWDSKGRRDNSMGSPSSEYILKFNIIDNVAQVAALRDPLDNASTDSVYWTKKSQTYSFIQQMKMYQSSMLDSEWWVFWTGRFPW